MHCALIAAVPISMTFASSALKTFIIDGAKIQAGDSVLAISSNGLHTNGYSLVRLLMDRMPQIKLDKINGLTFMEQIMKPHLPYYKSVKDLFEGDMIHGMAHITGGGIEGNLTRVIPEGLSAVINLSQLRIPNIFKYIRSIGNISDTEMLRTFNCGVGFTLVVPQAHKNSVIRHISRYYDCYELGTIEKAEAKINFQGKLTWL